MKNLMLFIAVLLSVRVYSQKILSRGIEYNPKLSALSIVCDDIKYLPDSLISLHFKTLRIEKCYDLNFTVLFRQLSKHEELQTLYLTDCNITRLSSGLSLVPNLKVLILDNNSLKSFPKSISKLKLESLSLFGNKIGCLSYCKQFKLFASISKLASSSGLNLNLSSNGIDSLPNNFKELQLTSIDISDNNFTCFPSVLVSMINDNNLRVITVDNIKSLLNKSNILGSIENKYKRSYVNIFFACFIDDFCYTEKELDYLNETFSTIHFSLTWKRVNRKYN